MSYKLYHLMILQDSGQGGLIRGGLGIMKTDPWSGAGSLTQWAVKIPPHQDGVSLRGADKGQVQGLPYFLTHRADLLGCGTSLSDLPLVDIVGVQGPGRML